MRIWKACCCVVKVMSGLQQSILSPHLVDGDDAEGNFDTRFGHDVEIGYSKVSVGAT